NFLFLSSRRRHTRWPRDWSSDVCSSDLWSNSNSGSGGQKSSVNCAPEVSRSAQPRRSPPTANAGGGRPDTSDCTPRCRTATSTGSEYQGLPAKPQPTEPPDTDPYVRWCGRGLTEGPQPSVSPYPDQERCHLRRPRPD